tara:strand:+ start:164 stop:925 length:762 start_codon:yes stop_codon:yes gene_type:complete
MKFAIPTYKRYDVLINKTLKTLECVYPNLIYIFVYGDDEYEKYKEAIGDKGYNLIKTQYEDLNNRLNYMFFEYFKEGEKVILIEDDIRDIIVFKNNMKMTLKNNLMETFEEYFKLCEDNKLFIWGISPTDSTLYMKEEPSFDLKFIIGVLYGIIIRHDFDLKTSITYKQDMERSILYHKKDKGMVRINNVFVKTTYRALGGLGNDKKDGRLMKEISAVNEMLEKYPDYVYQDKNKEREIKLFRNPKLLPSIKN